MESIDLSGIWLWFLAFWSVLDAMFSFINNCFELVFNAIPGSAISFLIGIFCYSIAALLSISINHYNIGYKYILLRIFNSVFLIILILFSIWRFGLVSMLEDEFTVYTFTEFLINAFYVLFGVVLFVAFYKRIPWLRKALLIFLWGMLLLLTFIICPILEGFVLSDSTLVQILIIAAIFAVPNLSLLYQEKKMKGESEEDNEK